MANASAHPDARAADLDALIRTWQEWLMPWAWNGWLAKPVRIARALPQPSSSERPPA
jgi:hypothetical protein